MSRTLIVYLLDPAAAWAWQLSDAHGRRLEAGVGWPDGKPPVAERVLGLVPAEKVLCLDLDLPARNRSKAMRALAFRAEEQLAEDVDRIQFVCPSSPRSSATVPVLVVRKSELLVWRDAMLQRGLRVDALIPDALCLPWSAGLPIALQIEDRVLVRKSPNHGFACAPDWLPRLAPELNWLDAKPAPSAIAALELLARGAQVLPGPNLIADLLEPQAQQSPVWRWAALLAGLVLVSELSRLGLEVWRLASREQELQLAIEQVFAESFPEVPRVTADAVAQFDSELRRLRMGAGAQSGALELLVALGQARGPEVELSRFAFRGGALDVELNASSVAELEAMRALLGGDGRLAELRSVQRDAGRVKARLVLQGAGG